MCMGFFERAGDLNAGVDDAPDVQLRRNLREGPAGNILVGDPRRVAVRSEVDHAHDPGMVQLGREARFRNKSLAPYAVDGFRVLGQLDGDRAIESDLLGEPYYTVTAGTQLSNGFK